MESKFSEIEQIAHQRQLAARLGILRAYRYMGVDLTSKTPALLEVDAPREGFGLRRRRSAVTTALIYQSEADWDLLRSLLKERRKNAKAVSPLQMAAFYVEIAANESIEAGKPTEALTHIQNAQLYLGIALGVLTQGDAEALKRMGVLEASAAGRAAGTAKRVADRKEKDERIRQAARTAPRHWSKEDAAAHLAAKFGGSTATMRDRLHRLFPGEAWKKRSE